jgi:hypothetical protein
MASTRLTRTPSSGDNQKYTVSCWVKRTGLGASTTVYSTGDTTANNNGRMLFIDADDKIEISYYNSGYTYEVTTNRVLRDTNAWYHIVVAFDSTQATASDRIKIWVNGEQESSFATSSYPSLNASFNFGSATHYIGDLGGRSIYSDFVLSHLHYIDGTAYDASYFGETDATTGIWKPKTQPSVTYGSNGVFLKFENSAAFGTDSSGNGNTFTVNGTMTQTIDTPSNVFATLNALMGGLSSVTYSNGNTTATFGATGTWYFTTSTLAASQGKYYAEVKVGAVGGETSIGIIPMETVALQQSGASDYMGKEADSIGYTNSGSIYKSNSVQESVSTYTTGDIIGIAFDLTGNSIQFYKNGTSVGSAVSLTSGLNYTIGVSGYTSSVCNVNFGNGIFSTTAVSSAQNPDDGIGIFEYDVPAGYRSLCTKSINAQEYS